MIMGKMKHGIYCCLIADVLTKVLAEMSFEWSSSKYIILDQTSQLDWLHGSRNVKLRKNIKKSTPQKLQLYKGDKAETLQNCL